MRKQTWRYLYHTVITRIKMNVWVCVIFDTCYISICVLLLSFKTFLSSSRWFHWSGATHHMLIYDYTAAIIAELNTYDRLYRPESPLLFASFPNNPIDFYFEIQFKKMSKQMAPITQHYRTSLMLLCPHAFLLCMLCCSSTVAQWSICSQFPPGALQGKETWFLHLFPYPGYTVCILYTWRPM